MKLGVIILIYFLAGVVIMENQFMKYLLILILLTGIALAISLLARLFRSYSTVNWTKKIMLRFGEIMIIGLIALITFKPLMGLIFK